MIYDIVLLSSMRTLVVYKCYLLQYGKIELIIYSAKTKIDTRAEVSGGKIAEIIITDSSLLWN